jgi:hypothetical protein
MHTLGSHFGKLLENIRPPQNRLDAAQTLPDQVREYLEDHEDFATIYPHSRLVGSYRQHLSVGDVKDVDFLVRVDGDPEENDPSAKSTIGGLRKALGDLPGALGYEGETDLDIERARRSVHVYFTDEDFHLDVVPCIAPDGFDEAIWVPDWDSDRWVKSHPLGVVELIKELEEEHPGKFRNTARLLKHFRNFQMATRKPKSYWLVALAIEAFRDNHIDSTEPLAIVFADLLNYLYKKFAPIYGRQDGATPNIKDPMLGHNVSWNWQRSHFETLMRRLDDGRTWAKRALEQEDKDLAIEWWQKVFDADNFPTDVTEYARAQAAARQPGSAVASRTGLILPAASVVPKVTPVPSTRYYGDPGE